MTLSPPGHPPSILLIKIKKRGQGCKNREEERGYEGDVELYALLHVIPKSVEISEKYSLSPRTIASQVAVNPPAVRCTTRFVTSGGKVLTNDDSSNIAN